MNEPWPRFAFEYDYEGITYCFSIRARNAEEAQDRVKKLAFYGRYCGEIFATIPVPSAMAAPASWLVRLWCWWKNRG